MMLVLFICFGRRASIVDGRLHLCECMTGSAKQHECTRGWGELNMRGVAVVYRWRWMAKGQDYVQAALILTVNMKRGEAIQID